MAKATGRFSKLYTHYRQTGTRGVAEMAARWLYWNARLAQFDTVRRLRKNYKFGRTNKKYGIRYPLIVYQMGKVGSTSIYDALRGYDLDVPVEHVHALNYLDKYEQNILTTTNDPRGGLRVIADGRAVRQAIDEKKWDGWNLVSLVRMPIPRAISEFFHNLKWEMPDFQAHLAKQDIRVQDLTTLFVEKYKDLAPLAFFNEQVRDLFGIDVYATPFVKERGYQIYERDKVRLLVLRMEDLDRSVATAMREFVGVPNFVLPKRNVGERRFYGELYKGFLEQLRLPPPRVQAWHSTPYAQHFYTPDELARGVARWT